MIPGIETLLGGLLGGAFRLGQAILDAREKQRDRDHEFRMTEIQGQLAEKANEARIRELGVEANMAVSAQDAQMLVEAVKAQSADAQSTGGWVSALSATVRPITTYLFAILYLGHKAAHIIIAAISEGPVAALAAVYTPDDMAIMSAILAYWYADRSLRRGRSAIAS